MAGDACIRSVFATCSRLSGIEAWRRIADPINEDKIQILRDLLALLTYPRPAASLDVLAQALEVWDTILRLLQAVGGSEPASAQKRVAFIGTIPPDVSVHVTTDASAALGIVKRRGIGKV